MLDSFVARGLECFDEFRQSGGEFNDGDLKKRKEKKTLLYTGRKRIQDVKTISNVNTLT
jgi:hypothetical protein